MTNMTAVTSVKNRANTVFAPAMQRWNAMDRRRQRIFASLGLLAIFALALAFIWLPAIRAHERLLSRLPELSAQLSTMQREGAEVRTLSAQPTNAATAPPLADIAALQVVFGEGAKVSVDANRGFHVAIPKVAYAAWWDRLDEAQARYALGIVSLTLTRVEGGNREVSVDLTLADRARSPQSAPAKP